MKPQRQVNKMNKESVLNSIKLFCAPLSEEGIYSLIDEIVGICEDIVDERAINASIESCERGMPYEEFRKEIGLD